MYCEFALHFMYQTLLVLVVQKYFYYLLNLLSFGNFCDNNDLSGILYLKNNLLCTLNTDKANAIFFVWKQNNALLHMHVADVP